MMLSGQTGMTLLVTFSLPMTFIGNLFTRFTKFSPVCKPVQQVAAQGGVSPVAQHGVVMGSVDTNLESQSNFSQWKIFYSR